MKRLLLCVLMLMAAVVSAQAAGPAPVTVSQARIRWLPGDLPMAGYFRITSHAPGPLYLVGADSPAFGMAMLHRSVEDAGVSRMEHVDRVTLNPAQTVVFAPGGYHLMLMQRKQDVRTGQAVPLTLRFSNGETITTRFRVVGIEDE
jgi:copper(I)-binding protein